MSYGKLNIYFNYARKDIFIQSFDKIIFKHHFLRIMGIGNGPKMTHLLYLIFDVISLNDVLSSIGLKFSDAVTSDKSHFALEWK